MINRNYQKKIALVFSGQPRFASIGAAAQLKILPQADLFFHTWSVNSIDDVAPWVDKLKIKFDDIDAIIKNPQTKKYEIAENNNVKKSKWTYKSSLYSMYFSIYQADKLRQEYELANNFEYDIVIKTRFDFLPWGKMFSDIHPNVVLTPKLRKYPYRDCDYFFVANSPTMTKITSLYNHLDELYNFKDFKAGEELLAAYALKQDVILCEFDTSGILIRDSKIEEKYFSKIRFKDSPILFMQFKFLDIQKNLIRIIQDFLKRLKASFQYRSALIQKIIKSKISE